MTTDLKRLNIRLTPADRLLLEQAHDTLTPEQLSDLYDEANPEMAYFGGRPWDPCAKLSSWARAVLKREARRLLAPVETEAEHG